jgi:hypothetical protein
MLLKILPSALHASPLSVQALQSRSCLSYVSHATTAAIKVKVKVKVTLRLAVGQSVSLGVMTRYLLLFDSYDLVLWGALSEESPGLSFVNPAGPRQRSLSRVRVPWISRPHFIVSVLRLPFSSPPTTRRVTVEVFDPASTRVIRQQSQMLLVISHWYGPHRRHISQQLLYCSVM